MLDIMMPGIDGLEVCRELRKFADTPVIMLTAKGQREDREAARKAGADLFITKPFANTELVDAVKSLADGRPG